MTRVGPLFAEITAPESEKFTAALILVHGLWERAPSWRRFAGYLAHRGWRCIAVERRADAVDVAAQVTDLRAAIASLDASPVVLGHDLGANVALGCADVARATVALAPLADASSALQHAGNWFTRWRGTALRAPRGAWRGAYPNRDVVEPATLVQHLLADDPSRLASGHAQRSAVFALEADEVVAAAATDALARRVGAELQTVAGMGHAALSAARWETAVADVHRWIIQRLGVDLLALYDEAMNPE